MRFFSSMLVLGLLMTAAVQAPAQAATQDWGAKDVVRQSVGIVDIQALLRDSKAGKSIQKQMETLQKTFKEDVSAQEKSLRTADEQLGRQRTVLSQEAFEKKRIEFQKEIAEAQGKVQEKKRVLDTAFGKAVEKVQSKAVQIIAKVAEKRKLLLVIPRNQVILAENSMDLTQEVMAELDKDLSSVKVVLEKSAAE
jgi:outer membrane protein